MCFVSRIIGDIYRKDTNKNMYEVIVETFCISRCIYATCNAVKILFDGCYEDKMDAVKAYDDKFKTYYRESEGDLYYKENGSFKIEKKRNGYSIIIRGDIIIKGEADK